MIVSPKAGGEGVNLQHEAGTHGAKGCVLSVVHPHHAIHG